MSNNPSIFPENTTNPRVFIVSGPSGVGKSTLIQKVLDRVPDLQLSVSLTTRKKRANEVEGKHYHFVDKIAFERMNNQGAFLEWAVVYDNYYGTSHQNISDILAQNHHALLDLDTQGAMGIKRTCEGAVLTFIMPPDMETLKNRLRGRGSETEESLEKRMAKAEHEIGHKDQYHHVIVNAQLEEAVEAFVTVINQERERPVKFTKIATSDNEAIANTTEKAVQYALERFKGDNTIQNLEDDVKNALRLELEDVIRQRLESVLNKDLHRIVKESYQVFQNNPPKPV